MSWEGVGVGRRLSDSSRELEEGVGGLGELGLARPTAYFSLHL